MWNASQINRSQNSVRVERISDLNESDLGEVYCTPLSMVGDMLEGGADAAVTARVMCAWKIFRHPS